MAYALKPKLAREPATRDLCRLHGVPEDDQFEGKPMWYSFLLDVDAVLEAIGWKPEQDN